MPAEEDNGIWRWTGANASEWTKTYENMVVRASRPGFRMGRRGSRSTTPRVKLVKVVKQVDPDGVTTLYASAALGEQSIVANDVKRDGIINSNGTDRIRETARLFTTNGSVKLQLAHTYAWATNNSAVSNLISLSMSTVDGLLSWSVVAGVTNRTREWPNELEC